DGPQERGVQCVWQLDVIDVVSQSLDQPGIFGAPDALTYKFLRHTFLRFRFYWARYRAATDFDFIFFAAHCTDWTMCWYPVQRQRFPSSPWRISSSLGSGLRCRICVAAMIMPGVQYPHCRP